MLKKNTLFFLVFEIVCIALLIWMIISGINFTFYREYPSFSRTIHAFQNTSVQDYLSENYPNSSVYFETVKSKDVENYLDMNNFTGVCPNLSKVDFSVVSGESYVLMINARTFEVECDWIIKENLKD